MFCYLACMREQAETSQDSIPGVPPEELASGHKKRTELSDLVGRWTPDPAFDGIVASQRRIDPDKWK